MTRLGIGRKLWLVCLAFGLPIVVMFVLMTKGQLDQIAFTEKELIGDRFQRPLEQVLRHASKHWRLWARSGRGDASTAASLRAEAQAVESAIDRLVEAEHAHGEALQFTPHGLGLRDRADFTAGRLREKWRALQARLANGAPPASELDHAAIIAHARTMITHAGDTSNLILDPDLDSYYLMDVTLLTLPQMEERILRIALEVDAVEQSAGAPRGRLATLAAFLAEADCARVIASTRTAINEDPNFQGVSPSLRPKLEPELKRGAVLCSRVVERLRTMAGGNALDPADLSAFRAEHEDLHGWTYGFHAAAFDEEDALLRIRATNLRADLHLGFALAALSVLVSCVLAFGLAADIVRRVLRIARTTDAFAGGDLAARVGPAGTDELGQLARSFDAMTERIGRLNAEVRQRAGELAAVNQNLEQLVDQRTAQLRQRNEAFRLILDNAQDGMLTVDLKGVLTGERSLVVDRWLGACSPGATLQEIIGSRDPTFCTAFRLGLEQIADDFLPLELTLDQLPPRLCLDGRQLRVAYRPITEHEKVSSMLLVLSDVTREIEAQRAAAVQEETLRIFNACQRDRFGFLGFVVEANEIVAQLSASQGPSIIEAARHVHTLKGNCALFGVFSVAGLCHEIESRMADQGGLIAESDLVRLAEAWNEVFRTIEKFIGERGRAAVEVTDDEYASIVSSVARGTPRREILTRIARWRLEPVERPFTRFSEQARAMARRLGKEIDVTIEPNDVHLCPDSWRSVWSALSHVIRNAVDHGIEPESERVAHGKPARGQLRFRAQASAGWLSIEVSDDGRGIAWDAVAAKAKARGMAVHMHADLVEAIFADGLSTKDSATELSGRGVGMAAVRQACRALGGDVEIESEPGRGTLVRCSLPEVAMIGERVRSLTSQVVIESRMPPSAGPD